MNARSFLLCLTIFIGTIFMSAAADSDFEKIQASHEKWQTAKTECGGDYSYKVRFSSFSGFGNETEVVVRANKVAERRYREFGGPPAAAPAPPSKKPKAPGHKWVEKGDDLGSHDEGAPAKTLDELYARAKEIAALELQPHEKRYVKIDEAGLLRSCFTIDTRIADDAPTNGVILASLKLGAAEGKPKVHKSPNGKPFPAHWGAPPLRQTRDFRPLPGGYGNGSGTLVKWIQENLDKDAKAAAEKK